MDKRQERLEQLFDACASMTTAEERSDFLARECDQDPSMRSEIEALLVGLDRPVPGLDAETLASGPGSESEEFSEKVGAIIGGYKLIQQIGEGGFGLVFMAEQEAPVKRQVALKVLKPGLDTKEVVKRFQAERQALAMMEHPNIASVFDAGITPSGRPFFVMELIQGLPITDYCDQHELDYGERLNLFVCACEAVQHAHQKGIIHRDIKPSNILVTTVNDKPLVKVIDFGIAKATASGLADETILTRFGHCVGTPAYMSPEQADLSVRDVDTRADVFSLGVVLYVLLTGKTPFDSNEILKKGLHEMLRFIREEEPPKPSTRLSSLDQDTIDELAAQRGTIGSRLCRTLRGDLDWVVLKAMDKVRDRRYSSPRELVADIQRFQDRQPVSAAPPSVFYVTRRFVSRRKLSVAVSALFLSVGLFGLSLWLWRTEAKHAAYRSYVAALREAKNLIAHARFDQAQEILLKTPADQRGWEWGRLIFDCHQEILKLNDFFELDRSQYDSSRSLIDQLSFDASGQYLFAMGSQVGLARLYDVEAGRRISLPDVTEGETTRVAFHPSEARIAIASNQERVIEFELDNRRERSRYTGGQGLVQELQYSADGERIALLTEEADEYELIVVQDGDEKIRTRVTRQSVPLGEQLGSMALPEAGKIVDLKSMQETMVDFGLRSSSTLASSGTETRLGLQVSLGPSGKRMAQLFFNATGAELVILDLLEQGELYRRQLGPLTRFSGIHWFPDGKGGLVFDEGATIIFRTGSKITLQRIPYLMTQFAVAGNRLVFTEAEAPSNVLLWDLDEKRLIRQVSAHADRVRNLAISRSGNRFASAGFSGVVKVWNADYGRDRLKHEHRIARSAVLSRKGQVITMGYDGLINRWDMRSGSFLGSEHWGVFQNLGFMPLRGISDDEQILATAGEDRVIQFWDTESWESSSYEPPHAATISSLDMGGSLRTGDLVLASASFDHTASIAFFGNNLQVDREVQLLGHEHRIRSVAIEPSIGIVATGSDDRSVRVWRMADGELLKVLNGHAGRLSSVAFSPSGDLLASADLLGRVLIWDAESLEEIGRIEGPTRISEMDFSSDGTRLAIGYADLRVRRGLNYIGLYNLTDPSVPEELLSIETGLVDSVAFADDNHFLLAGRIGSRGYNVNGGAMMFEAYPWIEGAYNESGHELSLADLDQYAFAYWRQRLETEKGRWLQPSAPSEAPQIPRSTWSERSPERPSNQLDLTVHYNGRLDRPWLRREDYAHDLYDLDLREFADRAGSGPLGERFDLRGVVQLTGSRSGRSASGYPTSVSIMVDRPVAGLRILHGATSFPLVPGVRDFPVPKEGEPLAYYILRYEEGQSVTNAVRMGVEVRSLLRMSSDAVASDVSNAALVEAGSNFFVDNFNRLPAFSFDYEPMRLYETVWTNTLPNNRLRSIDFQTAHTALWPFLLAITVDPPSQNGSNPEEP